MTLGPCALWFRICKKSTNVLGKQGKSRLQPYESLNSTHGNLYISGKARSLPFQKYIVFHSIYKDMHLAVAKVSPIFPKFPIKLVIVIQHHGSWISGLNMGKIPKTLFHVFIFHIQEIYLQPHSLMWYMNFVWDIFHISDGEIYSSDCWILQTLIKTFLILNS